MERSDDDVAGMDVHEDVPDEVMQKLEKLKIKKPQYAPETRVMEQAVAKLRGDWPQEPEAQEPKGKAKWDWLNNDVKEKISAKVLSEKGRTRTLKFNFDSFLYEGNQLFQVLTRDLKDLFNHCHTKRSLMPILPDHKQLVHKTFRLLMQSVFKLLPNEKPRDDAVEHIDFDTINLSERDWRMVSFCLRRYEYFSNGRNYSYVVEFEEPEEVGVNASQQRTPNKFTVYLYHWVDPVANFFVRVHYEGPMRFQENNTLSYLLVDRTNMSQFEYRQRLQNYKKPFDPTYVASDEDD
jgi:hypothetical protein